MKFLRKSSRWIVGACLGLWVLALLILVTPSITTASTAVFGLMGAILIVQVPLTIVSVALVLLGMTTSKSTDERFASSVTARALGALILGGLLVSTYAAIKSLWLEPSYAKYAYENLATGLTFGTIVLTLMLSAIQHDIYWVTRAKAQQLDERQIKERQRVFEVSYKVGTVLVLVAALYFVWFGDRIPALIAMTSTHTMPAHLYYPAVNVALTLFALPLTLAAWKLSGRRKAAKK